MSALLTMVGVSSTVPTLKVATSAHVPLATPWTAMDTTVQVRFGNITTYHNQKSSLCVQKSMSAILTMVDVSTTVPTLMAASSVPVTLDMH